MHIVARIATEVEPSTALESLDAIRQVRSTRPEILLALRQFHLIVCRKSALDSNPCLGLPGQASREDR